MLRSYSNLIWLQVQLLSRWFDAKNTPIHCSMHIVLHPEIKIYKCNNNNAVEKTSAKLCQTLSSLDVKKIMTGNWTKGCRWFFWPRHKTNIGLNIKCANFWLGWSTNNTSCSPNPFFISLGILWQHGKLGGEKLNIEFTWHFSLSAIFDLRLAKNNRCFSASLSLGKTPSCVLKRKPQKLSLSIEPAYLF